MNNKDLIKQYVNTGLSLPLTQIEKLSPNDLKSYLRVRLMADNLKGYEYRLLDEETKNNYVRRIPSRDLDEAIVNIMHDSTNDDFLNRIITLRSSTEIKQNTDLIVEYSHTSQMIYKIVDEIGYVFSYQDEIDVLFKRFKTDEQKTALGIRLLNSSLDKIQGGFTQDNTPISEIINNMINSPQMFIKYIIDTNYKLNGDEKFPIDNTTFMEIVNIPDEILRMMFRYMDKKIAFTPHQRSYITKIID